MSDSAPPLKPVDELILNAWNYEASDLFLVEGRQARMKVAGKYHECGQTVVTREDMAEFWRRCGQDPENTLDKDVSFAGPNRSRFRVSLHRTFGRLGAVMRQVKASIPNFEALGLPEQVLMNWMERRSGLVLVTGPTGSGKSTSLASCLEYINTCRPAHIVTIEDPIEYQFHDKMGFFTQREVGIDTGSFFAGLRSALRQAPDVILLGEIRDRDSATVAVQAAETGHLVLGTLHSSGVEDTLERFLRLVPAEDRSGLVAQMANQLVGILSQQLIPAVERRTQVLVCEYLTVEGAVREWIREHKMGEVMEFMRRGESPGNRTQLQSLAEAYHTGKLSYEEAMAHAANPHEFDRMLRGVS